jgi:hypothetical protein
MRVDVRFWTAIVIIGFCGFSVARGLSIVQFSLAMANIASLENRAEFIRAWTGVPGVTSTALQIEVMNKIDASDEKASNRRRDELSALLAIKPLSPTDWLSLSGMQWATDQSMQQVLAALILSWVTGPNEGYVAATRGIFAVSLWQALSWDLRRRAALDVAAADPTEWQNVRAALASTPERVQKEVRTVLLGTGLSPNAIQQRLGF